jgi:hypothetical protein
MTATAAPTDTQSDPREVPGGGKLSPVNHIVRIVFLPASRSHGQPHDLTPEQLEAAETALKSMAPPSNVQSPATTMFDALKPTDIVAVGHEAASVRVIQDPGTPGTSPRAANQPPPTRGLYAHNAANHDTVLRVWTESDTIEYHCDQAFEIVRVERTGWKIYGAPENPFGGTLPYRARQSDTAAALWIWTSGKLPATANNQQYKATFKIADELIDPDVVCGDPPPAP